MKSKDTNRRKTPARMSPLPVEWMDPMSWRLPSGKALAEFALQSGFLAPLMMGGPKVKRKPWPLAGTGTAGLSREAPDNSGSFREIREAR
jgi:hypothetical protein